ncbi:MAG: SIMPL domain-containing protein [Actinomycetota bacterium]
MSTRAWAGGSVIVTVVAATLVVVLVTAASGQNTTPADGRPHTITVSSTATISTKPDEAVITFSVHTQNADSTVALNESSRIMNDVLAAMTSLGVADKDMETTNISLSPQTINRGQPDEATVYNSSTSLEVKIHDFDVIGPAIQKGVASGATSVKGVRFQVADPVGVKTQALKAAVTSAREKADALAEAAGTAVTGVVQIREGGSPSEPQPYFAMAGYAVSSDSLAVVPPHDITTKVSVNVIWSIG